MTSGRGCQKAAATEYTQTPQLGPGAAAEHILDGIKSSGLRAMLEEPCNFTSFLHTDSEKIFQYIKGDALSFYSNWISGRYPPWEVEPGGALSQRAAYGISKNLSKSGGEGFDVYITHDLVVRLFTFHWLGELRYLFSNTRAREGKAIENSQASARGQVAVKFIFIGAYARTLS